MNVLVLGELNLLRLIQLIYYGSAQLNLIVSAQLVCSVLDQLIRFRYSKLYILFIQYNIVYFSVTLINYLLSVALFSNINDKI